MTYGQYKAACEGYKLRLNRSEDLIRRQSWITLLGYADKNKRPKTYQAFWPIEIDGITTKKVVKRRGKRITAKEYRDFLERMR